MRKEHKEMMSSNKGRGTPQGLHSYRKPSRIQGEWCEFCQNRGRTFSDKSNHVIKDILAQMVLSCPEKLLWVSGNGEG